jgi:hypothetical protein
MESNPSFSTRHHALDCDMTTLLVWSAGWFSASRTKTLYTGEGPIYTLAWRGLYIAFANDKVRMPLRPVQQRNLPYLANLIRVDTGIGSNYQHAYLLQ